MFNKFSMLLIGSLLTSTMGYAMQNASPDNPTAQSNLAKSASVLKPVLFAVSTLVCILGTIKSFARAQEYGQEAAQAGKIYEKTLQAPDSQIPLMSAIKKQFGQNNANIRSQALSDRRTAIGIGICFGLAELASLYGTYKFGRAAINAKNKLKGADKNQGLMIPLTH